MKILKIDHNKLKNKKIEELYRVIGKELGFDTSDKRIRYNCCKVNISSNIQDLIYSAYENAYPDVFKNDYQNAVTEVTMMLAMSGAKVNKKLPDDTIEFEKDFITFES